MGSAAEKIEHFHVHVEAGAWLRQELLEPVFGISTEAARKYRTRGMWLEGKHWRTDPAGRIVYNRDAINDWMGGQL
jgi:hypothetical protein